MLLFFTIWIPNLVSAQYCLPLSQLRLTSSYGARIHPVTGGADFHSGIDLVARFEPIYAVCDAVVSDIGYQPFLGNYIRIKTDSLEITYGHLSASLVSAAEQVYPGQLLGLSGDSGRVTGPHLHLSVSYRGRYLHPLHFLKGLMAGP